MTLLVRPRGSKLIAAPAGGMISVTPNASANTKGNYSVLLDPVPEEWCGFFLNLAATAASFLVDIAIGPTGGGGEQVVVSNLLCSGYSTRQTSFQGLIPLHVPKGVRLSIRCQSTVGGTAMAGAAWGVPASPYWMPGFGRCTTLGANTADSGGQLIDPGAVGNTKGSYQDLTANMAHPVGAILASFGDQGNEVMTTATWDVDVARGGAGSEQILIPDWRLYATTGVDGITGSPIGPVPVDIPAGSVIRARSKCSITDATDRLIDIVLLCFG